MSDAARSRPIFLIGCPRSGTTLLRNMLRSHPNLTFPPESHFIARFYRAYGNPGSDAEAVALARRILAIRYVKRFQSPLKPADFAHCRTFRQVVELLFEDFARRQGKTRWADKTPPYLTEIPTLLEILPDAQFLHIIRDGRDVALSWIELKLEPGNVYTAAKLWNERIRKGRSDGAKLGPDRYQEVRFEELLENPEATLSRICEFVGEPYTDQLLQLTRLPGDRKRSNRPTLDQNNKNKWPTRMRTSDQVIFESVAGDLLKELGYPVTNQTRRISPMEDAWWQAHHTAHKAAMHFLWSLNPTGARTGIENTVARLRGRLSGSKAAAK
jgi:hypothetical protein